MQTARCLPKSSLEDFVLGRMADEPGHALLRHVESCHRCQQALDAIAASTSDDLIAALQGSAVAGTEFEREPALAGALAKITSPAGLPRSRGPDPKQLSALRDYRLLDKLGEGGMGTVYKAVHTKLDKTVALKVLAAERVRDEHAVERFLREMKAVGRLRHPNIVEASDAGDADGQHYLVMEYVDGVSFSSLVERTGPLPVAEACELVRQAADGLEYAHQNGMVHRDVKPSNIMVTADGHVKILDLGLALLHGQPLEADHKIQDVADPADAQLTSAGQLMGTLDYMAPEQCDDSHQVDIRADIYSLGATLYKLLTGQAPYEEPRFDTPIKKMMALTHDAPTPIRTLRPEVPELLVQVMNRMLAKQPGQRFETPARVATALTPFAETADLCGWLAGALESDWADLRPDSLLSFDSAETLMSDPQKKTEDQFDPYHVWLSIAPAEQPPHLYRLLGLHPFESDLRVIESAADRQMAHVRTFQSGKSSKQSQRLLNEISSAKLVLLHEAKKRAYDKRLQAKLAETEKQKAAASKPTARSADKPAAKPAAKPASKTATPIAVQPDAPSASEFKFGTAGSSVPAKVQSRTSPNWVLIGSVAATAAVLIIGIVAFIATRDGDPPVAQVPMPPPAVTENAPRVTATANKERDDNPNHVEPPQPSTADQSSDPEPKTSNDQASTSVEPIIEPTPTTNPPAAKPIDEPAENPTPIEISQDDVDSPAQSRETNPTTVSADQPVESDKLPIPAGEEVKIAEQLARELFAEDINNAKSSEEESKLGARLLDTAAQSQGKPAERFVLMKLAYDLATNAGNLELIAQSVAALDRTFQVDPLLLRARSLAAASKARMSSSASRAFTEAMLDLMTDAESAERFGDIVAPLRTLTGTTARNTNDTEFRKHVIKRLKQSNEREDQFNDARRAIEKLAADDTDAAAHEVLGKYLCFVKGDWTEGLPHLAGGSDERLKKIATDDLGAKNDPSAQIAVADAWYRLAKEADTVDSQSQLLRAAYWYRKAVGQVNGFAKLEAEKRLADIGATVEHEPAESVPSTTTTRDDRPTDDPATQIDAGSIQFVARAKLTDHNNAIWALAFGPGGILASCDQGSVRLWNLQSGKSTLVANNGDYPPRIAGCALSPDGKILAAGGSSDAAPLDFRNITAISNRREITKVPLVPEDMRFSPDGRVFAAIVLRHGAMLWDGKTGQRLPDLEQRYPAIMEIAFSPNGQYIATTGFNGVVLVNDVATGKLVAVLRPEQGTHMHALAWSPGGKMIAASGKNPEIQLWNFETRKPIGRLKGHTDQVFDAQFAPATAPAPVLVTGGTDNVLRVWNPLTGQQIAVLTGHNQMIRKIAFSPDGKAMTSGDESGVILLWEIRKASSRGN